MSDTPRTEAQVKSFDSEEWGFNFVEVEFAERLERELNAAKELIKKREQIILELTAAGNCLRHDKELLASAIRDAGGRAFVQWSTDNWIKAKEWDRIEKGYA